MVLLCFLLMWAGGPTCYRISLSARTTACLTHVKCVRLSIVKLTIPLCSTGMAQVIPLDFNLNMATCRKCPVSRVPCSHPFRIPIIYLYNNSLTVYSDRPSCWSFHTNRNKRKLFFQQRFLTLDWGYHHPFKMTMREKWHLSSWRHLLKVEPKAGAAALLVEYLASIY